MPSCLCFVFCVLLILPALISWLPPPYPSTQCPKAFQSPTAQPGDHQPGVGSPGAPQWNPDWIHSQIRGLYVLPFCFFAFFFFSQSDVITNPFSPFSCGMSIGSLHPLDGCRRHGIGNSTKEMFLVIKGGRQDPIPALLTQLLLQEGDKASSGPLRETIPTLRELVVSSINKSKEESPSPTGTFVLWADSVCTGIQGCSETL